MDPLSIAASISGVATAGISLSTGLYDIIAGVRNAPRDVSEIARGITELSLVLDQLQSILRKSGRLCRRKLLHGVSSAVERIEDIHDEIYSLIQSTDGVGRVIWVVFRRSKTSSLLTKIEGHKSTINLIVTMMLLALETRRHSRRRNKSPPRDPYDDDSSGEKSRLRKQAENIVQITHQSLQSLAGETHSAEDYGSSDPPDAAKSDSQENGPEVKAEKRPENEVQLWKAETNDTAAWLYHLVFSDLDAPESSEENAAEDSGTELQKLQPALQLSVQQHVSSSTVVDRLMSEWIVKDGNEPTQQQTNEEIPENRQGDFLAREDATSYASGNNHDTRSRFEAPPSKAPAKSATSGKETDKKGTSVPDAEAPKSKSKVPDDRASASKNDEFAYWRQPTGLAALATAGLGPIKKDDPRIRRKRNSTSNLSTSATNGRESLKTSEPAPSKKPSLVSGLTLAAIALATAGHGSRKKDEPPPPGKPSGATGLAGLATAGLGAFDAKKYSSASPKDSSSARGLASLSTAGLGEFGAKKYRSPAVKEPGGVTGLAALATAGLGAFDAKNYSSASPKDSSSATGLAHLSMAGLGEFGAKKSRSTAIKAGKLPTPRRQDSDHTPTRTGKLNHDERVHDTYETHIDYDNWDEMNRHLGRERKDRENTSSGERDDDDDYYYYRKGRGYRRNYDAYNPETSETIRRYPIHIPEKYVVAKEDSSSERTIRSNKERGKGAKERRFEDRNEDSYENETEDADYHHRKKEDEYNYRRERGEAETRREKEDECYYRMEPRETEPRRQKEYDYYYRRETRKAKPDKEKEDEYYYREEWREADRINSAHPKATRRRSD